MKFTVAYKAFADAIAKCATVAPKRDSIAILNNVMVRCDARNIVFRAFDLDVCVDVACVVGSDMPATAGAATFPCHDVAKFIKAAKCDIVEIEALEASIVIRAGHARVSFPTLPTEDFPHPIGQEAWRSIAQPFTMAAADWHAMIGRVQFAISTEETRYYLNGVYIHETKSGTAAMLRFVTTDGHRLANTEIGACLPRGDAAIPGVVFPRLAVAQLKKLLPKKGDVAIAIAPGNTVMQWDNVTYRAKNIDGTFPDYERITPKDNARKATLSRADLSAMLPRILSAQSSKSAPVKMGFSQGELTVSMVGTEGGIASETMAVDWQGEALEVGFNGKYLADILAATSGADVEMRFDAKYGAGSPVLVTDPSTIGALFVQMPMRV